VSPGCRCRSCCRPLPCGGFSAATIEASCAQARVPLRAAFGPLSLSMQGMGWAMVKAFRFYQHGGPEVMEWEDVDLPPPGAGHVRLPDNGVALHYSEDV